MRKIDLDPPATKTWQRWLAACDKATAKVCARVAQGKEPVISSLYRRRSIKRSYFLSLLESGDTDVARDLADIQAGRRTFTMAQRAVLKEAQQGLNP